MRGLITISPAEATIAYNALRIAAERYDLDAAVMRRESERERLKGVHTVAAGFKRTAQQFDTQAANARALADVLEEKA